MTEVKEGQVWTYTDNMEREIDIEVSIVSDDNTFVQCEVVNPEIVRKDVESAKRTLTKNGRDFDNAAEVHQFATSVNNTIKPNPTICFFGVESFLLACEK